jgi:hypothetical protein
MWWLLTAVVCTIVGFFLAICVATVTSNENDGFARFASITAFVVIVLYTFANLAVYGCSLPHTERQRTATFAEAAAHYGLDSETPYPLSVGDKSVSLSGNMTVNGGLFHVSGQAQFQGGTSLLVDFRRNDGTSKILEIPLANIEFTVISDSEASTMTLNLDNSSWSATGYQVNEKFDRDCHASFRFGWWPAKCTTSLQSFVITPSVNEGLAGVLQKVLANGNAGKFVEMRVHKSDYDRIVGTTDSTMETQTETPTPSPTQN